MANSDAPSSSSSTSTPAGAGGEVPSVSLEDCLRLLRGDRDEQKFAGLLLTSRLLSPTAATASAAFSAAGPRFFRRLLLTGLGKSDGGGAKGGDEEKAAYLQVAVAVLASLARASPEVAANREVVAMLPLIAEIAASSPELPVLDECYELATLIVAASEDGASKILEPGVTSSLLVHVPTFSDGTRSLELANQLMQLIVHKITFREIIMENVQGVLCMVIVLARMFSQMHNSMKFDALYMLSALLSLKDTKLDDALRKISSKDWAAYIHVGITAVLQNRIVSDKKLQALHLAECMMSIIGEKWLFGELDATEGQKLMPADKFILLVLESARIEAAVLLNDLAYLKYESSLSSSDSEKVICQKQQSLAISLSLIEKFINVISSASEEDQHLHESTILKAIGGLNETLNLVLDYLQDAKDHGQKKGDDLLAVVRFVGSYLAEAPDACKEKTTNLLDYMLSIEGNDESRPFYSISFMLPVLSQITTEDGGCRILASGGYRAVVDYLTRIVQEHMWNGELGGNILLAFDTVCNYLSKRKSDHVPMDSSFVHLLQALAAFSGSVDDPSVVLSAASVCTLLLAQTSEQYLLSSAGFDLAALESLGQLIIRSLVQSVSDGDTETLRQRDAIMSGCSRWADRFPQMSRTVQEALKNEHASS